MKAVLIDDEPKNIRVLKKLLTEFCPQVSIVGEASGIEDALPVIRQGQPDVVFLDIEMPYGNAFDLLDKLIPIEFEVIFITAFDSYALRAFKYSALDYLLKPVSIEELVTAVNRVEKKLQHNTNAHLLNLLSNIGQQPDRQRIAIPQKDEIFFIQVGEIVYCEASGGYTRIFRHGGKTFVSSRAIREYEEILPQEIFLRIHNSYIVNLRFVKKYQKGRGGMVEMENGATIEVAARRREEFLARLGYK